MCVALIVCMITAVIFDFDGTLIDSDEVKDTAYHLLFPDVPPELIDKARAPEEAKARRGEGSRETIIRAILERLSEEGTLQRRARTGATKISRKILLKR
jgi:beta-phosphoglucomutase-like phosphatase (HAD superfamily)